MILIGIHKAEIWLTNKIVSTITDTCTDRLLNDDVHFTAVRHLSMDRGKRL